MNHQEARKLIEEGFRRCYGQLPTREQAQCLQAIGWLETNYAQGWSEKILGARESNNWGAITAGSGWSGATFDHRDSYPDDKGVNHWYVTKFRSYPSLQDGATDLCNIVYLTRDKAVLHAATLGSTLSFSTALYNTGYYKGFGATADERIAHHHAAVQSAIALQCRELGEPPPYPIDDARFYELATAAEKQCNARARAEEWLTSLDADFDGHGAANIPAELERHDTDPSDLAVLVDKE